MFHRERAIAALEAKRDRFSRHEQRAARDLESLRRALERLGAMSRSELEARLAGILLPGARPTREQDRHEGFVVSFTPHWEDHAEARAWAKDALLGSPTFAVDGSQISPSRDFSVPVGAVQVGWYENPHAPGGQYLKDLRFEVLAPDELGDEDDAASGFPDWRVNWRRFEMECQVLIDYMESCQGRDPAPVCFFDGSLILSFAQRMRPERRDPYLRAVCELIDASEADRIPLIGYVDASYAKDLVTLLAIRRGETAPQISDGAVVQRLMRWGDRTAACICARDDSPAPAGSAGPEYYHRVCFTYLKTTADRPPARLDFPAWLVEDEAELARTLDVVRAECVVGNGYPYAIETADAVAVITMQDRQRFYSLFQQFAERERLGLRLSRKSVSKVGRRS